MCRDCDFGLTAEVSPAYRRRVGNEGNFDVPWEFQVALVGVNLDFMLGQEVPTKDKVVNEVLNYSTIHSIVLPADYEAHVDDANSDDCGAVNADCLAVEWLELVFFELLVLSDEVF